MNSVKDFTIGQRVATVDGDGPVTKIGRKYVYVAVDGAAKDGQYLPEDLKVSLSKPQAAPVAEDLPVVVVTGDEVPSAKQNVIDLAGQMDNAAPVGGRPPMRLKGNRASADARRAARKQQRKSRRANRTR